MTIQEFWNWLDLSGEIRGAIFALVGVGVVWLASHATGYFRIRKIRKAIETGTTMGGGLDGITVDIPNVTDFDFLIRSVKIDFGCDGGITEMGPVGPSETANIRIGYPGAIKWADLGESPFPTVSAHSKYRYFATGQIIDFYKPEIGWKLEVTFQIEIGKRKKKVTVQSGVFSSETGKLILDSYKRDWDSGALNKARAQFGLSPLQW
jgi:hypothetical protein